MRYLPALTTLRFVAAIMIVAHHIQPYFRHSGTFLDHVALDQGVSFFFVLSGFILFYRHGEMGKVGDTRRFIAARIARVWPLHIATFAIILLFVPLPFGPAGPAIGPTFANILLVQAWVPLPGYFFSFNGPSWSISTELFFYLAYPALASGWRHSWPWKLAVCALLAVAMIWGATRAGLGFYDGTEQISIDAVVYIHPLARIFEFALGMTTAQLWLNYGSVLDRLPVGAATLVELAALSLAFAGLTTINELYSTAFANQLIGPAFLKWLVSSGSCLEFAVLTAVFATGRGWISRILSLSPLVILGEISFALYLCHFILFRSLTSSGTLIVFGGLKTQFVFYTTMVLCLSYALHRLIELPCQRGMRALLDPQRLHATVTLG